MTQYACTFTDAILLGISGKVVTCTLRYYPELPVSGENEWQLFWDVRIDGDIWGFQRTLKHDRFVHEVLGTPPTEEFCGNDGQVAYFSVQKFGKKSQWVLLTKKQCEELQAVRNKFPESIDFDNYVEPNDPLYCSIEELKEIKSI